MGENIVINDKFISENMGFLKAVVGAKTVAEAQKICAEYNMELPEDIWEKVQNSCCADELNEDDLNFVSGGAVNGSHLLNAVAGVVGLGAVIAAGSAAGVVVACAWIGYHVYKAFW